MKTKKWTFHDIPDLTGKTIIVTGGNSGLGYEAVKAFADKNATVVLASRSLERGEAANERIKADIPDAHINVLKLDLGDLQSVRDFANSFSNDYDRLDILMNNAGIMWCPYSQTKDGFESQMGVNHLGHFALTGLLLETLKKTKNSRVVNVSSLGHRNGDINFDNFLFEKGGYKPTQAYYNSKLANLLFTYELQRQFERHNLNIMSVAAHPGGSATNLSRYVEENFWFRMLKPLFYLLAQSAAIGTLPQVRAAVDSHVKGSDYYGPRGLNEMGGYPILVESTKASHNLEDAQKLWELSEELTKVKFNF